MKKSAVPWAARSAPFDAAAGRTTVKIQSFFVALAAMCSLVMVSRALGQSFVHTTAAPSARKRQYRRDQCR